MKKNIIIITFLICIIPNYTFADWACLIKDSSAEFLLEYIKNNKTVINNISKEATNKKNKDENNSKWKWLLDTQIDNASKSFNKAVNSTVSIFNEMFNFEWFFSYFDYFAIFPIINDVPYQVRRDYKLLDNEDKWLVEYVKRIDISWVSDVIVKDACNWVSKNCDLNNKTVKNIIWELIQNNDKILDLYRLTVMWDEKDFEWKLILVDNNFVLDIWKYYWTDSISACNSEKWWFYDTIVTKIENINLLNKEWKDWIQKWRDAWDLLIWKQPSKEALRERELLATYLSEQWIWIENQQIMNNTLNKYNQSWLSLNNNFLTNTVTSTFWKVKNRLSEWKNAVAWDFFENLQNIWSNDSWGWNESADNTNQSKQVNYNDLNKVSDNSKISKEIQEKITKMYNDELPFASIWDINTENIRSKIIQTHISLDDSINILDKTIPTSQKVCSSQDGKRWKCD